jgi:hypothetical protein
MHVPVIDGSGAVVLELRCRGLRRGATARLTIRKGIRRTFRLHEGNGTVRVRLDKPPDTVEPLVHLECCSTGSDGAAWHAAGQQAAAPRQIPIEVLSAGEAGDLQAPAGRFEALYGGEPDGTVLVRPGGFVRWRARSAGEAAADDLAGALATILKL